MKKRFAKKITAVLTAAVIVCGMAINASAAGHKEYLKPAKEFAECPEDRYILGNDRYDTAVLTALEGSSKIYGAKYNTVVLVSGQDYPDALSASLIANREKCPIIYADSTDSEKALDFVRKRTTAKSKVYIVGGTSAVPVSIEKQLKSESHSVTRLFGTNRYATNLAVLNYDFTQNASIYNQNQTIYVCSGTNYPDALVASAGRKAILLVSNELSKEQMSALKGKNVNAVIVGGPGAVSSKVEKQLTQTVKNVSRIAGETRYETSAKFAQKYFPNAEKWVVVDGNSFPDALCGTYLAAGWCYPIILASKSSMTVNTSSNGAYSSLSTPAAHFYIGRIVNTIKSIHKYYYD